MESVLSQTYPNIEVIIVNDGSTDNTSHIIEKYEKENNNVKVVNSENEGVTKARIRGVKASSGDWIGFVDGDDYLFEGTVEHLLRVAQDNRLDILMFGFRKVYQVQREEEKSVSLGKMLHENCTGNTYMYRHNLFGSCWTLLFQRQLLDDSKYGAPLRFTEGIYIEDEEFVTKLMWRAQNVMRVNIPVYAYYQRVGSTVHSASREHTDELFANYFVVLKRLIDFEDSLATKPHEGVTRKLRFLAVDILRRSLRENDWKVRWSRSAQELEALGLYPIPAGRYSWKYSVFRLLAWCSLGLYILRLSEKKI